MTSLSNPATPRFKFGENWQQFLENLTDRKIDEARIALVNFLETSDLQGLSFLDIGCGSGLHSYAAHTMGAKPIVSFDYDPASADACRALKNTKAPDAESWSIFQDDILHPMQPVLQKEYDLVYSWGVLHHTGSLWQAIKNAADRVKVGGRLHIALYNKHWTSPFWKQIKATYCRSPRGLQNSMLRFYAGYEWTKLVLKGRNPQRYISSYNKERGMDWLTNLRDWLGGYPYEYATPAEVIAFVGEHHLELVKCLPNNGTGCSEFLFKKSAKIQ